MAAPINTPLTGDIWHLSIDDLFAALPEKTRLGGRGPFVINLSVSTAPMDLPGITFLGCQHAHVYQVQRSEDRRLRYRLRLGSFANEDDADAALEKVRDIYPGALTATADADDLRAIATLQAKASVAPPPVLRNQVSLTMPVAMSVPKARVAARKPKPLASACAPVRHQAKLPLTVVAAAAPPTLELSQAVEPAARVIEAINNRALDVESTQTVRALTVLELEDQEVLRWFVIQLSLSEEAFDSQTVPNLDIFNVYRLYSVAGIDHGRIVHALRLGFFSEEVAAAAVASYLGAHYEKPTVKRVSAAERDRFAEQRFEPRKDVEATGTHTVIEITSERYVREKRTVDAAPPRPRTPPTATRSFGFLSIFQKNK